MLIGAPEAVGGAGAAYLFDLNALGNPPSRTYPNPTPAAGDHFGASVASWGDQAIIGAPGDDDAAGPDHGAVYLFGPVGGLDQSIGGPEPGALFGQAVAAVGDQVLRVLVGAPLADGGVGSAFVYNADGSLRYALPMPASPSGAGGGHFGASVAATATAILVGAPDANLGVAGAGAAYLFEADTGDLRAAVQPRSPATGDGFGASVALRGNDLIVGAVGGGLIGGRGARQGFLFPSGVLAPANPENGTLDTLDVGTRIGISATTVFETPADRYSVILHGTLTDPGALDRHDVTIRWGDGTSDTLTLSPGALTFVAPHRYVQDAPDLRTITVRVADRDGGSSLASINVLVRNAAPLANAGPDRSVAEGMPVTLNGSFTDPGALDTHTVAWLVTLDGVDVAQGRGLDFTFTPRDKGTYVATLTVTDDAGDSNTDTTEITVAESPPQISASNLSLSPSSTIQEGDTVVLSGSFNDINPHVAHAVLISWGDGRAGRLVLAPNDFTFDASHLYRDDPTGDPDRYTIAVRVEDLDDPTSFDSATIPITVTNVDPGVAIRAVDDEAANNDGSVITLMASVADPGLDDTFDYNWSLVTYDSLGNVLTTTALATNLATPDQVTFRPPSGAYTIELDVRDDDGGVAHASTVVYAGSDDPLTPDVVDLAAFLASLPIAASRLIAFGYDGDDTLDANRVTIPVELVGGQGDDRLLGGSNDDLIRGGDGSDTLSGASGNDTLSTSHGNDLVDGGLGDDEYVLVFGSNVEAADPQGNDTINVSQAETGVAIDLNLMSGQAQMVDQKAGRSNTLSLTGAFENLVGSTYDDEFIGNTLNNKIAGGGGGDVIFGGGGLDSIDGGDGNDTLMGGAGADGDTLNGGMGDDNIIAGDGMDSIDGGMGNDIIDAGAGDDTIMAGMETDGLDGGFDFGDDTLMGGMGNDIIFGGGGLDSIDGGDGNDMIDPGPGGGDMVDAGAGDDTIMAGMIDSGDDMPPLGDTLMGGMGNDIIFGGDGLDSIDGGEGDDMINPGGGAGDMVDAGAGDDTILAGMDDPIGEGNPPFDTLMGGMGNDIIFGGDGLDSIDGGEGDDSIDAGAGDDTIMGGMGDDSIDAGAGDDTIMAGNSDPTAMDPGDDTIIGGMGNDIIFGGAGIDSIDGGDGNDMIDPGPGGGDMVDAGSGDDTIMAGMDVPGDDMPPLDDTLIGGMGNDIIFGGDGFDSIDGGAGG